MEVRPGGFAQLTLLEGHPAYLMRLEPPESGANGH